MENKRIKSRNHAIILAIAILGALAFVVCMALGRFYVPPWQALRIIGNRFLPFTLSTTWTDQMQNIVLNVRLPRMLGAVLVGAALSLSGATYQGIFKNPLVSPDLLGVSSGACVGASFAILMNRSPVEIQLAAFVTGLAAVFFTSIIPRFFKASNNMMLVLAGIIVSGFMTSLQGIIKFLANPETDLANIVYWTMGSLSSVRMRDVAMIGPPIIIFSAVLLLLRWRVNLMSLGDREAKSLGVNVSRTRGIAILSSTVLTACSVCISGTIGWIGLVMPHLARMLVGDDNRYLMPATTLLGVIFMLVVDTLARNLVGSEIPLSILTGILGTPFFLWLLIKQKARVG